MIAVNAQGLLYTTHAALPHLSRPPRTPRARSPTLSTSALSRVESRGAVTGVYNMTKFGVNGFTEALRQEVTRCHVRVGVLEPGGVATELGSHNTGSVRQEI